MSGVMMDDSFSGCFGGCFFKRISQTVTGVVLRPSDPIWLSSWNGPPLLSSAISRSAALSLHSIISLENTRAVRWNICVSSQTKAFRPAFPEGTLTKVTSPMYDHFIAAVDGESKCFTIRIPHRKLGVEIGMNGGRSEIMAGV